MDKESRRSSNLFSERLIYDDALGSHKEVTFDTKNGPKNRTGFPKCCSIQITARLATI